MNLKVSEIKHFDARTLSWWVRHHYSQPDTGCLDYDVIVACDEASIMEFHHKQLDFHRGWRWIMLDWGWVLETTQETAAKEIIKETLVTHDGREAVITARRAVAADYGEMWACDRDDTFPVGCIVRLTPLKKPCMRELQGQFPF